MVSGEWGPRHECTTGASDVIADVADLRLPHNQVGTVAFKTCDDCAYQVKRVNASTQWVLDGTSMPLEKFRRSLQAIDDRKSTAVTVLHHLEDDRVTRVSVHPVRQR